MCISKEIPIKSCHNSEHSVNIKGFHIHQNEDLRFLEIGQKNQENSQIIKTKVCMLPMTKPIQ